jgi:hypothetical protein
MYSFKKNNYLKIVVFLLCLFFISACGGGDEKQSSAPINDSEIYLDSTVEVSGQALMGPLSKSKIFLKKLDGTTFGSVNAEESEDITEAGIFNLKIPKKNLPKIFVIEAYGGNDIDADDNGQKDDTATINKGSIHALIVRDKINLKNLKITPLTEIIYRNFLSDFNVT